MLSAFKTYYQEYQAFVRTVIYWTVRDAHVDDLVQETFLKAWKNFDRFKGESQFKTWIYRIAINTCYDYLRTKPKISDLEIDHQTARKENLELRDLITQGLSQLSEKHREVFILFYKLELTAVEISQILSTSEGTVKSRLHYAREQFVKFLKDNGVDDE